MKRPAKKRGITAGSDVAVSNDLYALYFTPAGLAQIKTSGISVARQMNSDLPPINFSNAAMRLPILDKFGISTVVAAGYIPRLHMYAEGAFAATDLESLFFKSARPGVTGDFDGIISSKTKDYRIALPFSPKISDR